MTFTFNDMGQLDKATTYREYIQMKYRLNVFLNILLLIILCISCSAYSGNRIYAVVDLPPYGCQQSVQIKCINTEYTQVAANVIDDGLGTIQVFPYPRALDMFESGQSPVLVALANKRLMEFADAIELFYAEFYLVSMELGTPLGRRTISYLRGADAHKDIASSVAATQFEVNGYNQIEAMLRANRLDYVIVPRGIYKDMAGSLFINTKVVSKHTLPIMLYVNKNESRHLERIKDALSQISLPEAERYRHLFK